MNSTCEIIRRPFQVLAVTPRQSSLAFTSVQLADTQLQRARALSCLSNLLMLAAGGAEQEANDDQR